MKRKVEDQRNRKKDSKEGRKRGKEEEEWGRTNVRVEITIVKNRRARAAGGEGQRERGREFATADRRINDVFHSRHFCAVSSPR